MRRLFNLFGVALLGLSLTALTGCSEVEDTTPAVDTPAEEHFEGDGHDHADHEHAEGDDDHEH
jgi:hypothetical protein